MSHPPAGELIVRNGKHAGLRLPMRHPVTAIGAAAGCDIKLGAEGINPIHCVIAITADGPVLRAVVGDSVMVNGEARADAPLANGDEVKIGPCVLQVAWTPPPAAEASPDDLPLAEEWADEVVAAAPPPPAPAPAPDLHDATREELRAQAAQLAEHYAERERQTAEQEAQLAEARAAFRREREADRELTEGARAEAEKLKEDARRLSKEAERKRANIGRLTARFIGRAKKKWTAARKELDAETHTLADSRGRFTAEVKRFEIARSDFYASSAAESDRLRDAWAAVEGQQKRVSIEWAEANDYFAKQEAAYAARAADLAAREKALADARGRQEAETSRLRSEAAGLDARAKNARVAVEELERKRDALLAELVTPTATEQQVAPAAKVALTRSADRDLTAWAAELDAREALLNNDRARIAAAKQNLDRNEADLADQRRVLAEQFVMLAGARSQWQQAEQRTVAEMEDLARGLGVREQDLDAREHRLIAADARRRDDAFELWQLRLKLEGWQAKLTAFELAWHTDRAQAEENIARRSRDLGQRESTIGEMFGRWEQAREWEQDRLRTELQLWAADRERMLSAAAEYDRQRGEALAEVMAHASRALAAEQALADSGTVRDERRLMVLQKRWERSFARRLREIEERRAAVAAEFAGIEERYQELHARLTDVTEREAALNAKAAKSDEVNVEWPVAVEEPPTVAPKELLALREELDRLATVLLETDFPAAEGELPWGAEDADRETVLPFTPQTKAA
jgi:hypothetical protein